MEASHRHAVGMSYIGHIRPDRSRNIRDVATHSTNTVSRSVTSDWNANPTPNDAIIIGRMNANISRGLPAIGNRNMSGT